MASEVEKEENESPWLLLLLVAYNVLLAILSTYTLVKVWPTNPSQTLNSTSVSSLNLFNYTFQITPEIQILLVVITLGALGSFIHTATSLATFVGNKNFKKSWTLWYFLRPLIGSTLALVVYFAFRAGFLNPSISLKDLNLYGIAAASALAGMFSKDAVDMLSDVFSTLFKSQNNKLRKDGLTKNQAQGQQQ